MPTTFSRQPFKGYWTLLTPLVLLVCIAAGWRNARDSVERWRLVVTQALHWCAFFVVMNAALLPSVQRNLNAGTTGLAMLTLLSLATFTSGVHLLSWQVCLLGLIMALGVPAMVWVESYGLFILLIAAAIAGIGVVFWWYRRERRDDRD